MSISRKLRKTRHPPKSALRRYAKYGLTQGRVLMQELASKVGWIMMRGHYQMGWEEYEERQERQQAYEEREWLRLMARQKFIETKRIGKKLMIRLTEKGWQQALRDKIRCARACKGVGLCLVIFDVPESEKHVRNVLRYVLAECGFTMLQKSVWVTRKDVVTELCALLQGANLDRWVRVVAGNECNMLAMRRGAVRLRALVERATNKGSSGQSPDIVGTRFARPQARQAARY